MYIFAEADPGILEWGVHQQEKQHPPPPLHTFLHLIVCRTCIVWNNMLRHDIRRYIATFDTNRAGKKGNFLWNTL